VVSTGAQTPGLFGFQHPETTPPSIPTKPRTAPSEVGIPRHRIHEVPLTAAERQARCRKLRQQSGPPPTAPARRLPPRPQRWAAAIATLIGLQNEYRAWLDNLPDNLEGSRLADKLQEIAALDLEELQAIDPPRGYGRD
jgi:hypothetical protein